MFSTLNTYLIFAFFLQKFGQDLVYVPPKKPGIYQTLSLTTEYYPPPTSSLLCPLSSP